MPEIRHQVIAIGTVSLIIIPVYLTYSIIVLFIFLFFGLDFGYWFVEW